LFIPDEITIFGVLLYPKPELVKVIAVMAPPDTVADAVA
jgi:hypothetical protein